MSVDVRVIEVLGQGCARCQETHRVVRHVVDEAQFGCDVRKVESMDRMVELGVLRTPGIAIDGAVVFSGRIPGVGGRSAAPRDLLRGPPRPDHPFEP